MAVGILSAPGELLDQGCLAAAGFAGDKDGSCLPGECLIQVTIQPCQLALPGDKSDRGVTNTGPGGIGKGKCDGSKHLSLGLRQVCFGCALLSVADVLVQGRRFGAWFDAQFLSQRLAAGLILGQGGPPLATNGQ